MKSGILASVVVAGALLVSPVFAGSSNQGACPVSKAKKAIVKVVDGAQNGAMDAAIKAKKKVTGKQNTTFVSGHYNSNGTHVKGHLRTLPNPISGPGMIGNAKKALVKTGDKIQNKVMDGGVAIKQAVTGKKGKTFVTGHYTSDGTHVKGHFRKVGGK